MPKILSVTIAEKVATYLNRQGEIVCGNDDYKILFTFDEDWNGYDKKTARFIWNGQFTDVDFTGNEVDVPVIAGTTSVKVGVYTDADGPRTSTSATIGCKRSILCEGGGPSRENDRHYYNEAKALIAEAEAVVAATENLIADQSEEIGQIQQEVDDLFAFFLDGTKAITRTELTDVMPQGNEVDGVLQPYGRPTAMGLTIVDGTTTTVKKVQGLTHVNDRGELVGVPFSGIKSWNADGTQTDGLTLAEPITLGQFDTLDLETKTVTRQTCYIDCGTDPFNIGCSYSSGYKAYNFWISFNTAPRVRQGEYKSTDIVQGLYTVGGFTQDKRITLGRTAQDFLCIFIRDDEFVRFDDDGTFNQAASSEALKAHLKEIGFKFACKPSDVLSTETVSISKTTYKAWTEGTEAILPGEANGLHAFITQDYYEVTGG